MLGSFAQIMIKCTFIDFLMLESTALTVLENVAAKFITTKGHYLLLSVMRAYKHHKVEGPTFFIP